MAAPTKLNIDEMLSKLTLGQKVKLLSGWVSNSTAGLRDNGVDLS